MYQFNWFFASLIFFWGCSSEHLDETNQQPESNNGVSIELSLPHGESIKYFGLCWDKNPVDVIIRNQTDSIVHFYQNWNSWGYYNFHFEIQTNDSLYSIVRTKKIWWKDFPSYHSINPKESLVFHFDLLDSTCFDHNPIIERRTGLQGWTGLPNSEYETAEIKVIYELPERSKHLLNHGFRLRDSTENDTIFMFSEKIISKPVNITISK